MRIYFLFPYIYKQFNLKSFERSIYIVLFNIIKIICIGGYKKKSINIIVIYMHIFRYIYLDFPACN